MVSFCKFITCVLVTVAIYPALFLVSVIIHYTQAVVPPGIDQPLKLRLYNCVSISVFLLGITLEKLRLYTLVGLLRLVTNGLPCCRDSSLLIQNQTFDKVPVRIYQLKEKTTQKRKALLYFHGGAGSLGSIDAFERMLRHIAKECDLVVVAVSYGLGPENPYPNQYAECLKAAVHFMKKAEDYQVEASRIIIGGDSCGANFATQICQLLGDRKDLPRVHAQMLIYPGLQGMDFYLPSYQQNSKVAFLWRKLVIFFSCIYLNKKVSLVNDVLEGCHVPEAIRLKYQKWVNADLIPEKFKVRGYKPQDPALRKFKPKVYEEMKQMLEVTFSPLFAEDAVICKLPHTCILTCEFDVLRDDGLLYKKRLEDNGVPVKWIHVENGIHGIVLFFGYGVLSFPSAGRIVNDLAEWVTCL